MTWEEWLASSYNTSGLYLVGYINSGYDDNVWVGYASDDDSATYIDHRDKSRILPDDDSPVKTDKIVDGQTYYKVWTGDPL